jgi:N-acetylglucosamine-6-phosphate deacetylase
MFLMNAEILNKDFNLEKAEIAIEDGKISAVGHGLAFAGESLDLEGLMIVPGFVDIHIHGAAGFDACDASQAAIKGIATKLPYWGITSFCPTTMTIAPEELQKALLNIKGCVDEQPEGAAIRGINMEGPYISKNRKGGQNEAFVRKPDFAEFKRYFDLCGGLIKLVDIAPECEGADEFIENAKKLCRVSIAHTDADYETAKAAFDKGITHVTHLFNAMPGFGHREPGTVGGVFDDERVMAELICDGFHLHPATLRTAFRLLGEDRTVIVSDSMRAAGLPDGVYDLGGQAVRVQNGRARLPDGTIAGSTTNIYEEVKNLISFGVPFRQVIKSATINPARAIGEADKIGSIEAGKSADLVVLDKEMNIKVVILRGKIAVNNL